MVASKCDIFGKRDALINSTFCHLQHTGKGQAQKPETWKKSHKKSILNKRKLVTAYKSQPCADCGGKFPTCSMDFDHRHNKSFNIGQSLASKGVKLLFEEIAKCDVVCSNCHRIRTLNRQGLPVIKWWLNE